MKYVLLLRGINVGKSVKVSMKDLKLWLGKIGLKNVTTYLNSGNALFDSDLGAIELTKNISALIRKKCKFEVPVLVRSSIDIKKIAKSIPKDRQNDETQRTYIAYLFDEAADESIISLLPMEKEYVRLYYKNKAIVWNIKREYYNKSQITKLASHSVYKYMTTRNVNTARKLAELCIGK
jgi:uncharacterized protein (DUF1697 family)